jgi:RimJ/RimL family protein N-acetyltransferase
MAEEWITTHQEKFERGEGVTFAITLRSDGVLIGAIGLGVHQPHDRAELGYWIGKPHWGRGYCTEAARAVLHYGFTVLGLNRIHASHFGRNPASGRVMEKIGMKYEGCSRQHVKKWGVYEDLRRYAILKAEYETLLQPTPLPHRDRRPAHVGGARQPRRHCYRRAGRHDDHLHAHPLRGGGQRRREVWICFPSPPMASCATGATWSALSGSRRRATLGIVGRVRLHLAEDHLEIWPTKEKRDA